MRSIRAYANFLDNRDGGVAIVFGLSFMVLLLASGAAIDYARALSVQTQMQSDLDAAVLGAATQMKREDADATAIGGKFFDTNWLAEHGVAGVDVKFSKIANDKGIKGTAKANVDTLITKLFGFGSLPIKVHSEAITTAQHVEIALVLDTTGSMAGAKLTALKDAAKGLVESVYMNPDAKDKVKTAIVPFAQYVNVGMANRNKSWISVPLDTSTPVHQCSMETPVIGTSNCRMETFTAYNDGTPYTYQAEVCDYQYGPPAEQCYDYNNEVKWYGCVGSRDYPLDTLDEQYGTPIPGVMNAGCGAPITPLMDDKDVLSQQIDDLVAVGETYIPAGMFWGWTTLSKHDPFDEARNYGEKVDGHEVRKIMVLMTDGMNTLSSTYPAHDGNDTTQSNDLTAELCTNIKAKGIELFTVAFDVTDNTTKDMLEDCASAATNFYDASGATELKVAFENIAKSLAPLRLSE